tara:strand:+ start:651 stop:866 length:216 start_codon:yes stop_codon:yes gene_type:complete
MNFQTFKGLEKNVFEKGTPGLGTLSKSQLFSSAILYPGTSSTIKAKIAEFFMLPPDYASCIIYISISKYFP